MKKATRQKSLAAALGVTTRRLRQLEELGVVIRRHDGAYDVAKNVARYQTYQRRSPADVEELHDAVLQASRDAERAMDAADPDKPDFEKVARRAADAIHALDESMKLMNAMRPEGDRPMLDSFRQMVVGRAHGTMAGKAMDYFDKKRAAV